uniref:Uncharacterized protein n=1 Tax=Picea glauca TaxID=3330 RepID=A0A101M132_PICGL|nr:hypothetical protein ABT39_MTgene4281 [Picea glauca]QHR90550.1 hypothetical protein Q903MT_gene4575 [Picea sitchensis]
MDGESYDSQLGEPCCTHAQAFEKKDHILVLMLHTYSLLHRLHIELLVDRLTYSSIHSKVWNHTCSQMLVSLFRPSLRIQLI